MVTDCLAPIVAVEGVGTLVTMQDHMVLCNGLSFCPIKLETFDTEPGKQYKIEIRSQLRKHVKVRRGLFVTANTLIMTGDGWKRVDKISNTTSKLNIKVLEYKCLVCEKWYVPRKPYLTYCSGECLFFKRNTTEVRLVSANRKAVESDQIREAWTELFKVSTARLSYGIEAVRVKAIEGSDGIFVNGILISEESLLKK